jgi:hypothetical protein
MRVSKLTGPRTGEALSLDTHGTLRPFVAQSRHVAFRSWHKESLRSTHPLKILPLLFLGTGQGCPKQSFVTKVTSDPGRTAVASV